MPMVTLLATAKTKKIIDQTQGVCSGVTAARRDGALTSSGPAVH
ncbi:hypothetical protein [Salinibacter ruber]|uniref:Uncharacterized protein n=1 Tax=Salinibacter ruber TaxID=146919 RepID=A0AAW5P438_9BACT|nr:hypothetical protein [Salinibacter ruber]MCS3627415.1 hypothetical protein [Salinibacter ruber]MCS3656980.1 hypothetical protein [Salinibacter ruber]MCS3661940.1 hypothetical protein [Salinibacter ruber]MCS3672295.1 hypothetical protein [Salinibacter ruber]MCS3700030.1 hypothetical protein [Salinibacter ruber]